MNNEKKRKKRSLKGMTLVEIIISLAILSVLTLVLVGASGLIDKYTRSANTVNKTVAAQSPIAETKDITNAHRTGRVDDDGNPIVNVDGDPTYEEARIVFSYKKGSDDRTATVKGILYDVDDPANIDPDALGGALNMKFVGDLEYESSAAPAETPEESDE